MSNHLLAFLRQKNHIFAKNLLIFAGIFLCVFIITFSILGFFGLIPTEFERETRDNTIASKVTETTLEGLGLVPSTPAENDKVSSSSDLPYRIVSSSINLDATVVRPASAAYTLLNSALEKGAVYYPGSGTAGNGNMFIFGHSTSYQYVNNKAFQVFNNIKNLKKGDEIEVYGEKVVYIYKVREVKLVNANEELVSFSNTKDMLTLSTCNSFGEKSDRYVAEADFVSSHAI
jgi:LPXTG-site transpeptidase (sortase) family protein